MSIIRVACLQALLGRLFYKRGSRRGFVGMGPDKETGALPPHGRVLVEARAKASGCG